MTSFLNRKLFYILGGLSLFLGSVLGQEPVSVERSKNKVILEGTVYYIHVVKPGQTLYSISRAYNISEREIAIENPGAMSGIQVGQALKIPVEPALEEEIDTSLGDDDTGETGRMHRIRAGETLYGIARIYDLDEEALHKANPGIDPANLQPGFKLRIPEKEEYKEEPAYNEEGFAFHKVKKRETLYSIARFYEVAVQEIRTANPELGWGGPKTGQMIRIPLPQVIDHPESIVDSVPDDALADLESDSLPEDYQYEELKFEHENPFHTYKIAYFIPFNFQELEPLDSLLKDVKSSARRIRIIERYTMEQKIPQSVNFLEYFQGSLLALDSLRQTGMKLDVRYFDTKRSLDQTLSLLMDDDLEEFDLFIGPFYPFNVEIVSEYASKHRIPMVVPFYNEKELISRNPYLFQLTPSMEREYEEAAKLIASKHMYNIVYVRDEDSLNLEKHDYFKELIFDGFDDYSPAEPVVFKEVVQKLKHTDEIIHSLSPDKKNLIIVPTSNEALASRVVSSLYFQFKNYDIEIMGTPFWTEFKSITRAHFRYLHELNFIFYSSFWVDYLDPGIDEFMAKFRSYYHNEPQSTYRKGINYGLIGYDMSFYFMNALRLYGPRFLLSLDDYAPDMVQLPFEFDRVSRAGGYENNQITFYQFSPDMNISKIDVPELPERTYFFRPIEDKRRRRVFFHEVDWDR